jgi:hypothetical protein
MEIGEKYMHLYIQGLTCTILDITKKGAKVKYWIPKPYKWIGKRDAIQYYNKEDFEKYGLWEKIE